MKSQVPGYIIKYIECSQKDHDGEKVNLICLNGSCSENCLICSMCSTQKHKGHQIKPLKIYLDELYKRYHIKDDKNNEQLEQLQKRKIMLLVYLRNCVEKISQQFCKLQEDIINTYQNIKVQILQNDSRRNRFEQFYLSMIKDNYGDPYFEIKNYLFKEEIQILTDQDIFQELSKSFTKQIHDIRGKFLGKNIQISPPPNILIPQTSYLTPPNIVCQTDLFYQTNYANNAQNLCLFDVEIANWTNKLRVTILNFVAGSKVTFGVMKKEEFTKSNYTFKDALNCQYIDSAGKNKGAQSHHITNLGQNMIIDFFIKKNNLRAVCKNNTSIINLNDKSVCFFFVLEGNTKIKITYPYLK